MLSLFTILYEIIILTPILHLRKPKLRGEIYFPELHNFKKLELGS